MNKAIVSLAVLGAVITSAPAFAKSAASVPAKGAKIVACKTACKSPAPMKHRVGKNTIKHVK